MVSTWPPCRFTCCLINGIAVFHSLPVLSIRSQSCQLVCWVVISSSFFVWSGRCGSLCEDRPLIVALPSLSSWILLCWHGVSELSGHHGVVVVGDVGDGQFYIVSDGWGRKLREKNGLQPNVVARSWRHTGWASHFLGPPLCFPSPIPPSSRHVPAHIPLEREGGCGCRLLCASWGVDVWAHIPHTRGGAHCRAIANLPLLLGIAGFASL